MSVLTEYFRATEAASVLRAMGSTEGGPLIGVEGGFDGVVAKGVDPAVVLGTLVAAIERLPWEPQLVAMTAVWPTTPEPGPDDLLDEDDPWATGPWVSELSDEVRDQLAGVPDEDLPMVVATWVRSEELGGANSTDMTPVAEQLIGLARRAAGAGEHLYCWMSL